MTIHQIQQKTPEWQALRLKYPLTASEAQAIGVAGSGLETLVWEKMAERYSSQSREQFVDENIERGVELEPLAIQMYELQTGQKVTPVGFVTNEAVSNVGGASPDGLVLPNGLVEIKCFQDKKHFRMIIDRNKTGKFDIEAKYVWQMQMQLLFTGAEWCDFVSYCPNFRDSLLVQRILPDPDKHEAIRKGLEIGEKLIKEIEKYAKYQEI